MTDLLSKATATLPYPFAKQKKVIALQETPQGWSVAMASRADLEAIEEIRLLLKRPVNIVLAPLEAIEQAIERCYQQKEGETHKLLNALESQETAEALDARDLLDTQEENPIIRMVHSILLEAIQQGASDIHFEPTAEAISIRYRIDGVLHLRHVPPKGVEGQVTTRLKVMARLDIAEHRLPQDGRIKLMQGEKEIDIRVSTLPTVHGERIVLRILDKRNIVLGLEHMGLDASLLKQLRNLTQSPEGIVLVTGPTGSGKTTTLYSAIAELDAAAMNIMTIEDPVEYKLAAISQMNVNPKIALDFAKGLRSILRQDPDVIMIGEIRDRETAAIAIQASLTGHLVLSTLHTNDAPSALTRLADMGIEPYLLASSVLGVLAQRLVRRICPHCKVSYVPSNEEMAELQLSSAATFYRGSGCPLCFHSGYRGRVGIYELMLVSPRIKRQVLKNQDAEGVRKCALAEGMLPLFASGVQLVLEGVTTSAEVLRVTRVAAVEE